MGVFSTRNFIVFALSALFAGYQVQRQWSKLDILRDAQEEEFRRARNVLRQHLGVHKYELLDVVASGGDGPRGRAGGGNAGANLGLSKRMLVIRRPVINQSTAAPDAGAPTIVAELAVAPQRRRRMGRDGVEASRRRMMNAGGRKKTSNQKSGEVWAKRARWSAKEVGFDTQYLKLTLHDPSHAFLIAPLERAGVLAPNRAAQDARQARRSERDDYRERRRAELAQTAAARREVRERAVGADRDAFQRERGNRRERERTQMKTPRMSNEARQEAKTFLQTHTEPAQLASVENGEIGTVTGTRNDVNGRHDDL
jgi:hypothetical protein